MHKDRPLTLEEAKEQRPMQKGVHLIEICGVKRFCHVGGYVYREILLGQYADDYGTLWREWAQSPSSALRSEFPWPSGHLIEAFFLCKSVKDAMLPYNQLRKDSKERRKQHAQG